MRSSLRHRAYQVLWLLLFIAACTPHLRAGDGDEQRDGSFGFSGLRIFEFHKGVGPLATGDLNGDGRVDVAVADNYRGELTLLYQDPSAHGEQVGTGPNALSSPDGYRKVEILVSMKIDDMQILDLDHDGNADILLYGQRGGLEVRWGAKKKPFEDHDRYRVADGVGVPDALACRVDPERGPEVFLLATHGIHCFHSFSREHAPQRSLLPGSAAHPFRLFLADLDGDGVQDLLTIDNERSAPYRVRLRRADGSFGPELLLAGEPPTGAFPLRHNGRDLLIALSSDKARFQELGLAVEGRKDPLELRSPDVFPLDEKGLDHPRMLVGDLDGDGDIDVLVSNREDSSLLLLQGGEGTLTTAAPSPSLRNVQSLARADFAGNGKPEVLATSADEGITGLSTIHAGVVSFPKPLAGIEKPILAAAGHFTKDAKGAQVAVVRRPERTLELQLFAKNGDRFDPSGQPLALSFLTSDPRDILVGDFDNDGLDEVVIFAPYQPPLIFEIDATGTSPAWRRIDAPGTLENAGRGAVSVAENGDLLVAAGNHCRRVRIRNGKAEVVYQVNGQRGSSAIACAVEARLQPGAPPSLVLVDRADGTIGVYGGDGPQPKCLRTFDGDYHSVQRAEAADLDGDGRDEILLLDPRFLAVVHGGGQGYVLKPRFTYENPAEECRYVHGACGDLDADGKTDLVISDGSRNNLEIFEPDGPDGWKHALRFPVFEARSFESARSGALEPRRVAVADVTGDGLDDVLILVHDRLIIYPQDRIR